MKTKWIITGLAASALVAMPFAGTKKDNAVSVKVMRVAQRVNLDKGDLFTRDDADFYAKVKIGQNMIARSPNHSDDDGHPGWEFTRSSSGRYVPIRIELWDDDGGLEEKDDHVDINPYGNKKDLDLVLDTATGAITGDLSAKRGQLINVTGGGDDDKGEIWFVIN
jgi:hypothetical protein